MTPKDIETLSKKSAYKYYNTSHYDDLVSEGILAAYEEMADNEGATEQRIYQVINWAQWKFLNVDSLPVYMPENLVRMVKGMGSDGLETNYTDESFEWAKVILSQGQAQADHHDTDHTSNQEEELSKEDLLEKVWESAQECLTEEEYGLFYAHFELGLDGKSLGDTVGVSKQAMSKKFKAINQKVQKHVVNKKWDL
jgi:DNA-directed RNA polymerase specialized sigma subunit